MSLAAVYSRVIDDETLTLAASGWTYANTFVLYDHQTESMWYHLSGTDGLTCIAGPFADRHLAEFPSFFIRWNAWKAQRPNTLFLKYP